MKSPLRQLPPRPRTTSEPPRYPRVVAAAGVAAVLGGFLGCVGPPNMGGVVAVPYEPSASSSQVVVTRPLASSSAPQPAPPMPEPPVDGEPAVPFEQGN